MTTDTQSRFELAKTHLSTYGQAHLLTYFAELDVPEQDYLLAQVEAQDWPALNDLIDEYVKVKPKSSIPENLEPAPWYPAKPTPELEAKYTEAKALGERLIREGKVGCFVVAGGQGTRLGWEGPKGTYPATPIEKKPLFQVFSENIQRSAKKYKTTIPFYIMTSPINDAPTRAFFEENNYFGMNAEHVTFFQQGVVPSFSTDGKALLADKGNLATNPDGHGGSLRALHTSGALEDMSKRGIEQLSYFQVDNPLINCVDPLFIGLHALDNAQMSSKMVAKVSAKEKVGNFCQADGKITVIEYSDLPDALAEQTNADGSLRFNAGSIAIHVIATSFIEELNKGRFALPWHRADKKVPHIDIATGELVEPDEPNAVKLETFVFDAVPLCERSIVLETIREDEFGPIKNASGVDSAESSRELQIDRAARWLESNGVKVPRKANGSVDAVIEISPLTANSPEDLKGVDLPGRIEPGVGISL